MFKNLVLLSLLFVPILAGAWYIEKTIEKVNAEEALKMTDLDLKNFYKALNEFHATQKVNVNMPKKELESTPPKTSDSEEPYNWEGFIPLKKHPKFPGQALWLEIKETIGYILIILFTFICRGVEHLFIPISIIYAIKKMIIEPILKKL